MFAGKNRMNSLTGQFVVDRNNIQIDGFTENVMPLESLRGEADRDNRTYDPGKGVSFMEHDYLWHGKSPNKEEAKKALHELRTLGRRIKSEHE